MSDMEEETLDLASEQGTSTRNPHEISNADFFSLLKTYMDTRLSGIETSFTDTTHTLGKKPATSRTKKKIRAADTPGGEKVIIRKICRQEAERMKRPAEASGSISQTAHNTIPVSVSMPPFSGADLVTETRSKGPGKEICVSGVDYLDIGHPTAKKDTKTGFGAPRGTSFIVDIIENGYKIPLLKEPENMYSKNNKSPLEHSDFVSSAVKELVMGGLVKHVSIMPHIVNPLTVSVNGKDASDTGAAGFIQNSTKILHKMWLETEQENIFNGFWKNDTQVKNTELKILFRKMKNSVIDFKAGNTTVKYAYSFKRFVVWSEKYTEIKSVLPANEIYVSLYLQYLMQSAKHYSTIAAACYAIKWAHSLAGFEDPCASDIVKCIVDASKRKLNRPIQKKRTDEYKYHAQSF
ncbi:unnamed protein product [Mytilus edulis]|uniref:Uncharacterized protein n=1 Tax=Mytilus edulis TaxID=6550 RepID=A0A8S3UGM6_MYTED|nr:unnamed protein product [Mytilus edulis]